MEKNYPKKGKPSGREERGFNREDSGRNDDKSFSEFAKDKRKRITRVEKTEPRRKEDSGSFDAPPRHTDFNREEGFRSDRRNENRDDRPKRRDDQSRKPFSGGGERHSYNPNFTKDNKLRGEKYSGREDRGNRGSDDRGNRYGSQGSDDRGNRYGSQGSDDRGNRYGPQGSDDRGSGNRYGHQGRDDRGNRYGKSGSDDRGNRYGQRDYERHDEPRQRDFNRTDEPRDKDFQRDYNRPVKKNYGDAPPRDRNDRNDHGNRGGRDYRNERSGRDNDRDGRSPKYNPQGGKPRYDKPQGGYDKSQGRYDKPQSRYDKPQGDRGDRQASKMQTQGRYKDGSYPTFPAPAIEDEIRLNRYIAAAGKSSRREADDLIRSGRVTVNGEVVTEMGSKVKAGDIVQVDGETIRSEKKVYILMNKPKGFVTTLEDPFAEKTVMDLLRNACSERVYPVGRLDKNSLGVLLVTNDGDLTTHLTHPSFNKKKIYQVTLDKQLTRADMQQIIDGITLEDGEIHADEVSYVDDTKKEVGIEIHSGRNRVVRRIFEHLGYRVTKLDRVYFAGLTKKNLKRGQWRFLTPKEVDILKSGRYE